MWFDPSSEQSRCSSSTLLKQEEDVGILDVFNRKDGLNINAPDYLQMVCGSSINFEISNKTCSSASKPSSNRLSNPSTELDSSKPNRTARILKPPEMSFNTFSGNSVNDYQEYSSTAISPMKKDQRLNTEYYDDYNIDPSGDVIFDKHWQGFPVVYPEPASQPSGAGPILMVPPPGEFRMPVNMPMNGYPYPAFGMLPEDMPPYHRPVNTMPLSRIGHGSSNSQYVPTMNSNSGHSPNGLALSPMRSPLNANKVIRSSIPVDGYIYQVQFKRAHRNFILAPSAPRNIMPGDFVKVEADRGEDMGIVLNKSLVCDFEEVMPTAGYRGRGFSSGQGEKKFLYRLATMEERAALSAKVEDEERTLEVIREKVVERALPMAILDAEYQFDRHKLTFFFEAERRIDFRELVSELFSQYKTRIWMQQVDTSSLPFHDPGVELAQATGFLPVHSNSNYTFVQSPSRFGGESSHSSDGTGFSMGNTRQNYEGQSLRTSTSTNVSSCNTAFSSPERGTPSSQQRATAYPSGGTPFHSPSNNFTAIGSNTHYAGSKHDNLTFSFPEFGKDKSLEGRYSPVCVSTHANEEASQSTAVPLFESSSLWSYGL